MQSNGKLLGGITGKGFMPGRSGNPEGRKPGSSVTARLLRILEQDDGKVAEAIAAVIIREALRGKFAFAKEILDRVDGKVPHRVTVQDAGPVVREVFIGLDRV